jgi:hypothetical protein
MSTDLEQQLRDALHEDAERARLVHPHGPPPPEARPLSATEQRPRSARKLIAVAAVIALIAAASVAVMNLDRSPDVTSTPGPTPAITEELEDQAIADGAVLTPEDMPLGWEAAPPQVEAQWQTEEDDLDQAFADCLGIDVSELRHDSPAADSAFVNSYEPNDERVTSEVTVFAAETEAQEVIDRFRDDATQRCYLDVVEQQIVGAARGGVTTMTGRALSGEDIEVGESTIDELHLEYRDARSYYVNVGDDSIALRVEVPLSLEGADVDVYADFAFVRKGRVMVQTSFQTYFGAFDGGFSTLVAPQQAVLLTKRVLDRIPGVTSPDRADIVDPPVEPVEPRVLPEPGEQPADPASAQEQVRAAFVGLFDASIPREDRTQFVDRPEVWLPANQLLVEGQYGEAVKDLQAVVDAVVFTSPTHASVRFQLIASDPVVPRDHYIGDALLLDGRWVVDVTTPCARMAIAGVECDLTP